jgi:hypothetical protein
MVITETTSGPLSSLTATSPVTTPGLTERLPRAAGSVHSASYLRQFFEAIVEHCQADDLIWGKKLYADVTLVEANADRDNMLPRFAVESHLRQLFGEAYQPPGTAEGSIPPAETVIPPATGSAEPVELSVVQIGADLPISSP